MIMKAKVERINQLSSDLDVAMRVVGNLRRLISPQLNRQKPSFEVFFLQPSFEQFTAIYRSELQNKFEQSMLINEYLTV